MPDPGRDAAVRSAALSLFNLSHRFAALADRDLYLVVVNGPSRGHPKLSGDLPPLPEHYTYKALVADAWVSLAGHAERLLYFGDPACYGQYLEIAYRATLDLKLLNPNIGRFFDRLGSEEPAHRTHFLSRMVWEVIDRHRRSAPTLADRWTWDDRLPLRHYAPFDADERERWGDHYAEPAGQLPEFDPRRPADFTVLNPDLFTLSAWTTRWLLEDRGLLKRRSAARPKDDGERFVPNDPQKRILKALDRKALKTDRLVKVARVERRAFFRDHLPPLKDNDLVRNNKRVGGYYRPDAPPPDFETWLASPLGPADTDGATVGATK